MKDQIDMLISILEYINSDEKLIPAIADTAAHIYNELHKRDISDNVISSIMANLKFGKS